MNVPTKTIRAVTDTLIDYRGKTPTKTASGTKLITAKVIKGGFIEEGKHEYIATEEYDSWMRRGLPRQWDILITTEAPLGEVAQLRTPEKVALAQRVILLRGNPSIIDQSYYFHALRSPFVQAGLKARSTGTTVLGIKQSELWSVEIPCPALDIQRRIALILSAYDDLIENNTRRIKILEQMAQMLYREWFVNFRFPGHEKVKMVESGMGAIPEGWKRASMSSLVELRTEAINPARCPEETFLHFSIPAFDSGALPTEEKGSAILSNKFLINPGCILLSKLNPRIRRVWIPDITDFARAIASTEFLVLEPKLADTVGFLWQLLTSDEFTGRFKGLALGTSTSHQRVKPSDFLNSVLTLPTHGVLQQFSRFAALALAEISVLRRKCANLRATRDLLLPKLVSGEISVESAEFEALAQTV